jgi:hypothetical protein
VPVVGRKNLKRSILIMERGDDKLEFQNMLTADEASCSLPLDCKPSGRVFLNSKQDKKGLLKAER